MKTLSEIEREIINDPRVVELAVDHVIKNIEAMLSGFSPEEKLDILEALVETLGPTPFDE